MNVKGLVFAVFLFSSVQGVGQFYKKLPSFEIAFKGGYINSPDDYEVEGTNNHVSRTYEGVFLQGELSVHLGQHIALGYFQNRSLFADYHFHRGGNGSNSDLEGQHLIHGLNLRLSAGRSARLRPYLQLKYFSSQFIVDYGTFRVAREGTGAAAGIGLMIRIGHKFYINIVEAEVNKLLTDSDVLLGDDQAIMVTARTGLTYNFSKRK